MCQAFLAVLTAGPPSVRTLNPLTGPGFPALFLLQLVRIQPDLARSASYGNSARADATTSARRAISITPSAL